MRSERGHRKRDIRAGQCLTFAAATGSESAVDPAPDVPSFIRRVLLPYAPAWGESIQTRVWAFGVVVDPPCFGDLPSRRQAAEQVLVQALVAEPSVEALHEPVLLRFAWRDVVPQHRVRLLPAQDRVRRQLRAVVADNRQRLAAQFDDPVGSVANAGLGRQGALSGWQSLLGRGSLSAMARAPNPYRGFRYPAEVIEHAVWLYHCFSLSLRDVETILAARGIVVSYESVREWGLRFGRQFANELKRRRPKPGDKWHLDEVFIRIGGKQHYLWRAIGVVRLTGGGC